MGHFNLLVDFPHKQCDQMAILVDFNVWPFTTIKVCLIA